MTDPHENIATVRRVLMAMPPGEERDEAHRALDQIVFNPARDTFVPPRPLDPPPGHMCGHRDPCSVCELEIGEVEWIDGSLPQIEPRLSKRSWAFIPTNRELLHICLNCGNTERSRRME